VPTVTWTADGRWILFITTGAAESGGGRLLRISRAGGEPQFDGLDAWKLDSDVQVPPIEAESIFSLDVNENQSRVAFSSRAVPQYGVWLIENILLRRTGR
jgi:hypothetical protein